MLKVTIMIPTYNQEEYVNEAVQSALAQNYPNLEVVVSDDCSQDNTWKIINAIRDNRLKIFRNKKNLGRVKNYRKLLYELATGDFVINLDGDDYFTDDGYIRKAVELIREHDLDLVFSNQIIGYENKVKSTKINLPEIIDGNWLFLNYGKKGIHIPHMTAVYNRKKAKEKNFYSKDILSSDWESFLRMLIGSKIGFISTAPGVWRQLKTSESKSGNKEIYFLNIKEVYRVSIDFGEYFDECELSEWKYRNVKNMICDIPCNIYKKNLNAIFSFVREMLQGIEVVKFIFNYRFLGKILKCIAK